MYAKLVALIATENSRQTKHALGKQAYVSGAIKCCLRLHFTTDAKKPQIRYEVRQVWGYGNDKRRIHSAVQRITD